MDNRSSSFSAMTNLRRHLWGLAHREALLGERLFALDDDEGPVFRGTLFRKAQADYDFVEVPGEP